MSSHPTFCLTRDEQGRLSFAAPDGRTYQNVRVTRGFPITDPSRWVSITDERHQELAFFDDPSKLPEDVRGVLLDELNVQAFMPTIASIQKIEIAPDGMDWHVTTDRGRTVIQVESEDNVKNLGNHRVLIIDDFNVRYVIPDVRQLDRSSRKKLERYY